MSTIKKRCRTDCRDMKTKHEIWRTEGWPYGDNYIEICTICGTKYSQPWSSEPR